jgi:DNA segregation ATPase FtsK/SpoIIIE-like protein
MKTPPKYLLSAQKSEPVVHITDIIRTIEYTLATHDIRAVVVEVHVAPQFTEYSLALAKGVRLAQVKSKRDDIALALGREDIEITQIIGKPYVGIRIGNDQSGSFTLGTIDGSPAGTLSVTVGVDGRNQTRQVDITEMPHLLIAGTTGSGKSAYMKSLLTSLLMHYAPDTLRLVLIDPKMVEFVDLDHLPHLLTPVVTDAASAVQVLLHLTAEMDRRYEQMKATGSKQADQYIVVAIDELADLVMQQKDAADLIIRLAQKGRAAGIHVIAATQRPSAKVVDGLLKANFPARACFAVTSQNESRVVLDENGAELLAGKGDYLLKMPGKPIERMQAPYVPDEDLELVAGWWKAQGEPEYVELGATVTPDELVEKAAQIVRSENRASATFLQRVLRVGYAKAAAVIDDLESMGVISAAGEGGMREVYHA